jgi:transcriptional regulator with XRE-family HTH domain
MELAERAGVSYQQIQKYENDKSQITLKRLTLIARALDTPMRSFLPEERPERLSEKEGKRSPASEGLDPEERKLLSLFRLIEGRRMKIQLLGLLRLIVEGQSKKP